MRKQEKVNTILKILFLLVFLLALFLGIGFLVFLNNNKTIVQEMSENNHGNLPFDNASKTITLSQLGHINMERDRLKVTFGPSFYIPTGLYVEKDQKFTVTLNKHDQFNQPRIIISPPILNNYEEAVEDGIRLAPGKKEITATKEGILYIVNHSKETDIPPEVTIEGAKILPTYELGKTTIDEWKEQLKVYHEAPVFELISDKVLITASLNYRHLVIDPEKLLIKHNEAVDIQAHASGLDENDPNPVHHPTKYKYHFRHSVDRDFWMYAWYNHTGYHTDALKDLLNVETFTKNGWGPWHELGHVHQQYATTPSIFGEVTNNIFSMKVQREFGQASRLESDHIYEQAFTYLENDHKDYDDLDVWETLVSLWQLDLAYGEDLYQTLYRIVRETDDYELPSSDEEKIQKFVYWTSKAANQNLIPFFEMWGVQIEDHTREDIINLRLPELKAPIWWNRDTNNTVRPMNVTAESFKKTVEAYKDELTEEALYMIDHYLKRVEEYKQNEDIEEVTKQIDNIQLLFDELKQDEIISDKIYYIFLSQIELLE